MASRPNDIPHGRQTPPKAADLHRAWLELVDVEGPFLAIPPLKRVWPQGMPALSDERKSTLVDARKGFEAAWEKLDRISDTDPSREAAMDSYRLARDEWVETVLRDVAGWAESLSWGEVPGVQAQSPNRAVTITAQASLNGTDGIGALVHVIDPTDSLRQSPNDLWAATPVDRCEALLRGNDVPIGIVTDGRWWGLVCARSGAMAASGVIDTLTWIEEPRTRDAFLTLIGRQHIIGGDPAERLPTLFEESVAAAEEITEALGSQVRGAVELLIQAFSESAADADRRGLPDPLPTRTHGTYEAAVTMMMRAVFLLFAEERGLLPSGELFDQGYGIARELDRLIARETEESEEALDATSLTWHRLLATSQALHGGASFENLRIPAYGGSLFDPARFPFLTAINEQGTLAITVSDRVMLHVLRSIQIAHLKSEARRISFRDIDVEQIGYIYEGLLGYTVTKVDEVYLGLKGTAGIEPEVPLAKLEELAEKNPDPKRLAIALRDWVTETQPSAKASTAAAITKAVTAELDPGVVSALTQTVSHDHELRDRMLPWLGLIRLDLRARPFVVLSGGLVVKETPSRKNAGAHYTPKFLAEEVVLHALQPHCYSPGPRQTANASEWKLRSSDELLDLKVADIACGSGAFLVAAARYLAARLVEAWIAEDPANSVRKDLHTRAIRQVVANCLYGADINDMAVEMCKLSLWLVSLDRDLPFSFVDDKVFLGNSLLGITNLDQVRRLHMDPTRSTESQQYYAYDVDIDAIIRKAVDLRQHLALEINEDDPARSSAAKQRQLRQLEGVLEDLRRIADGLVATGLRLGGNPGRGLDEAYDDLRIAVKAAYPDTGPGDFRMLDSLTEIGLTPTVTTDYERWRPLHWVLEVPEVLVDHGGFDAVIGNPPFLVGKKISGAVGVAHRKFIVNQIAGGTTGNADLVAFFLLRAAALMRPSGDLGLVTAKAIAEGDTREVGLDKLLAHGFRVRRAVRSELWPAASAATRYSIVWGGCARCEIRPVLDGRDVTGITSSLEEAARISGKPLRLESNSGLCFKGYDLGGDGFQLTRIEAEAMIRENPRNADVLFHYLNGKDLNSNPESEGEGWAICFGERSLEQARSYQAPFARVEDRVLPVRMQSNRRAHRDRWWIYAESRPALTQRLTEVDNVIAISAVSRFGIPALIPVGPIMSSAIVVIPGSSFGRLAALASSVHQNWVLRWGSLMKLDVRYSTSDVFDTFPFPLQLTLLDKIGTRLHQERRAVMIRRGLGLTKLYSLVHDPTVQDGADSDVARLRALQVDLDQEVVAAYGWSDLTLDHGFYSYRQTRRWTVSPSARIEILDRLLEENHRRSDEEASSRSPERASARRAADDAQEGLFKIS